MIGHYERKLLEALVGDSVLQRYQMEAAIRESSETGAGMGRVLVAREMLTEDVLDSVIPKHAGIQFINLGFYEVDPVTMAAIPEDVVKRHALLPVDKMGDTLTVAFSDIAHLEIREELSATTGYRIVPLIGFESDIQEKICAYYKGSEQPDSQPKYDSIGLDSLVVQQPSTQQPTGSAAASPQSVPAGQAPFIRLSRYRIDPSVVGLVPGLLARQHCVMPVDRIERELTLAVCAPVSGDLLEELARTAGCEISLVRATREDIIDAIHRSYDM